MKIIAKLKNKGIFRLAKNRSEYLHIKKITKMLCGTINCSIKSFEMVTTEDIDHLAQLITLYYQVLTLDMRQTEHISFPSVAGIGSILLAANYHNKVIRFVSIASPAIDHRTAKLRVKEQYGLPIQIYQQLGTLLNTMKLPWTYEVLLANYDYLVCGDKFLSAWLDNLAVLSANCPGISVKFLSDYFSEESYSELLASNSGKLLTEAFVLEKNTSLKLSYKTTFERMLYQMNLYACLGLWLEDKIPTCILLDIQKHCYPYEQPYFNRWRSCPLPFFRYNNIVSRLLC